MRNWPKLGSESTTLRTTIFPASCESELLLMRETSRARERGCISVCSRQNGHSGRKAAVGGTRGLASRSTAAKNESTRGRPCTGLPRTVPSSVLSLGYAKSQIRCASRGTQRGYVVRAWMHLRLAARRRRTSFGRRSGINL